MQLSFDQVQLVCAQDVYCARVLAEWDWMRDRNSPLHLCVYSSGQSKIMLSM
jgi:hypothetical protein